eukprot:TRINITY_DN1117_c0_g1_i2.p1 TRINITY_DN1117_c0_g1~~TRINITY_DN1117_c0_g1_i2.p1  ORF type:complete len:640 (-),score=134.06 TRINITY_DN1117_c0_g1_i2:975-2894(-)
MEHQRAACQTVLWGVDDEFMNEHGATLKGRCSRLAMDEVLAPAPEAGRGRWRGSDGGSLSPSHHRHRVKQEVCQEVFRKLTEVGEEAVKDAGFYEELQAHFHRLPTRYAIDVNTERAEDVLMHKRLLEMAAVPENRPAFFVRAVHVFVPGEEIDASPESSPVGSPEAEGPAGRKRNAYPPAFGSSPNLEALAHEQLSNPEDEGGSESGATRSPRYPHLPMHEVTFSTLDKPKLLSQLSSLLADVNLNIREAHVFSTADGYSLDVFVVDGWATEETEELRIKLQDAILNMERAVWTKSTTTSPAASPLHAAAGVSTKATSSASGATKAPATGTDEGGHIRIPSDGNSDWEIDSNQLKLHQKVASGSFGDLFRGTYCGQEVAIKILKPERLNDSLQSEFKQEVSILRKVRHKNVVQFIGACTKPPNLSIVTEFMVGGSVYDYLHKQKGALKLPMLLKVAIDVSKGMDYLHQHNIIHRDLKAANLLMDENEVVKVADFGVARVQDATGIMTAETGTYRWMAPEVIEHKAYDHKADVFSFGVVLWELLTGRLPYADLTPLQAAVGVVQKALRPTIPKNTHPRLTELMQRCWKEKPVERPEFSEITKELLDILKAVEAEGEEDLKKKDKKPGFFSALKRGSGSK